MKKTWNFQQLCLEFDFLRACNEFQVAEWSDGRSAKKLLNSSHFISIVNFFLELHKYCEKLRGVDSRKSLRHCCSFIGLTIEMKSSVKPQNNCSFIEHHEHLFCRLECGQNIIFYVRLWLATCRRNVINFSCCFHTDPSTDEIIRQHFIFLQF